MRALLRLGVLLWAVASTATWADGVKDGTAAVAALNRGDLDTAIRLFTKALSQGDLSKSDTESAYFGRGKAYLAKGMKSEAKRDLVRALQIDPGDAEARRALAEANTEATKAPAQAVSAAPATTEWGTLAEMVGSYWIMGNDQPQEYGKFEWSKPGQVLVINGLTKDGIREKDVYTMNQNTREVYGTLSYNSTKLNFTFSARGQQFVETMYINNVQIRTTTTKRDADTYIIAQDKWEAGKWVALKRQWLRKASEAEIRSLNWHPQPGQGGLGEALLGTLLGTIANAQQQQGK